MGNTAPCIEFGFLSRDCDVGSEGRLPPCPAIHGNPFLVGPLGRPLRLPCGLVDPSQLRSCSQDTTKKNQVQIVECLVYQVGSPWKQIRQGLETLNGCVDCNFVGCWASIGLTHFDLFWECPEICLVAVVPESLQMLCGKFETSKISPFLQVGGGKNLSCVRAVPDLFEMRVTQGIWASSIVVRGET